MKLLGVTGGIHHGKTSLTDFLQDIEPSSTSMESSTLVSEVANQWLTKLQQLPDGEQDFNALNDWLSELVPIVKEHLHTDIKLEEILATRDAAAADNALFVKIFEYFAKLKAEPKRFGQIITPENKNWHRPLLQWLGGYLAIKSPGIWYREIINRSHKDSKKGRQLFIASGLRFLTDEQEVREAGGIIISINRPSAPEPDLDDPTERERNQIVPDITVINDGSLEQLFACTNRLWSDIQKDKTAKQYRASEFSAQIK